MSVRSHASAVGVLGGTFDPVHNGHLHVAHEARRLLDLERVLFVPAARPPHKPAADLSPVHHRLAMLRLAIEGLEGLEIDPIELVRPDVCYTIETLRILRDTRLCRPLFLLGADSLRQFESWYRWRELIDEFDLAVVDRDEEQLAGDATLATEIVARLVPVAAGVDDFGTTMNDYLTFLDEVLGLDGSTIGGETLGGGITINAGGQIVITGNEGTVQDLEIDNADMSVTYAGAPAGSPLAQPFLMTKTGSSDGESVRTSFIVYDSLGTPLTVDLTFVLQSTTPNAGSTWEFVAESSENDALDRVVGLGVVEFDANGRFVSATNQTFSLVRTNGAASPLTVSMGFDDGTNAITALTDNMSVLAAVFQDGSPIGTLSGFSIGEDGTISGSFTNGLTRDIGQLAMAKFSNPEGLVDAGSNLFRAGPNSGTALITSPLEFGTGRLIGGALELSNVDLSQEFINLILASTGYSAASRIITTTNDLFAQLLILGR